MREKRKRRRIIPLPLGTLAWFLSNAKLETGRAASLFPALEDERHSAYSPPPARRKSLIQFRDTPPRWVKALWRSSFWQASAPSSSLPRSEPPSGMPVAGGGFEQCYNAQAAVAAGSMLVVAVDVVQAPNDKQQLEPMLEKIGALPEELGETETLLADTGYFSARNVEACEKAGIDPLIAMGRQPHHPPLQERFETAPPAPENPTPVEAMAHRLKTPEGRDRYALRKQTPEPVFGIIKSALGFRQFSLRGLDKARGEWSLVTMAWNIKRMFVLTHA